MSHSKTRMSDTEVYERWQAAEQRADRLVEDSSIAETNRLNALAEVQRLRQALERIAYAADGHEPFAGIARAALNQQLVEVKDAN